MGIVEWKSAVDSRRLETTATSQYGRASSIKKNGCGERGKRGKKSKGRKEGEKEGRGGEGRGGDTRSDGIHSLSLSLPPLSPGCFQTGRRELPRWLPACLSARLPARSLARSPASPASLDYLKNRIPPARNCVSRLPCLYTNTRVREQCWMRCTCTTGPRLTGPAFLPA